MKKLALVAVLCLFPVLSHAAPAVTGLSGTIANDCTITISGTGFGTKSTAGPLISSYNSATSANNWSTGSIGANWATAGSPSLVNTSPLRATTTQSSYKISYISNGAYDTIGLVRATNPDRELYISMWLYRDNAVLDMLNGAGNNNKKMRVYSNATGTADLRVAELTLLNGDMNSIYEFQVCQDGTWPVGSYNLDYSSPSCTSGKYSNTSLCVYTGYTETVCEPQMQGWDHYEWYIKYPSTLDNTDTQEILWLNGRTLQRSSGFKTYSQASENTGRWIRLGQVSGATNSAYNEYIDQVYIDNTPSRVFISDRSNFAIDYANTAHNETQVPATWSATEITFPLNQGSFSAGDNVYVYVVDSAGAISGAYGPVAIGGAGKDTVPDSFSLGADNTAVELSTVIYAPSSVNVAGITDNCSVAISGTGCQYRVNAGSWITSGDNVALNDNVAVRTTSANAYYPGTGSTVTCTLTLGGSISDTWAAVTKAASVQEGTAKQSTFSGMSGGWK